MTRQAFAKREAPAAEQPGAVRRRDPPVEVDDAQDRLGAQGAFARNGANRSDPWTEIAEIVSRMLEGGGAATATPAPGPLPVSTPEEPLESEADREEEEVMASEPAPFLAGTSAPPVAPPLTSERRVLEGDVEKTQSPEIEMPEFPKADGEGIEIPKPPSEGGELSAGPPAAEEASVAEAPKESAGGGGSHKAIVRRWQGGVSAAGGAMPHPKVEVPAGPKAEVAGAAKGSKTRNEKTRGKLPEEAVNNVPTPPVVEDPPAPPVSNPVPEHTKKVLELSGKRLPDQAAPGLVKSPERDVENGVKVGGNMPKLGEVPIASDLFQVLTAAPGTTAAPGARDLAKLPQGEVGPDGKETPESKRVREALEQLSGTAPPTERKGRGEPVISPDKGPVPMKPLPPHLQMPVGQVVARLLAEADDATTKVLDTLRQTAYPGGVLKENFPDIGKDMEADVKTVMDTELREIAAAAGVSAEQLEGMVAERREELESKTKAATEEAEKEGNEAAEAVTKEGQKTADAVAGAADLAEEETLRRQEAAGGAADPQVINRRRDLTVKWIRDHVTTQITNYQDAGDKRVGELKTFQRSQGAAYAALVQREQFQVLTPQPPDRAARDVNDKVREKKLADITVEIRAWGDDRKKAMEEDFRLKIAAAEKETKANRSAIEGAGSAGIEAARVWAEDKILAGQSWWKRFIARIQRWLSEADSINEDWRVRRTRENRDAVAIDIQIVENARARMAAGLTQEQILADQTMSAGEKAILMQYFALGPGAHPLDFAAGRLRQNLAMEQLPRAREIFERELIATPVGSGDYGTVEKLNQVARSTGGGFDAAKIAQDVHGAMDQIGTDEGAIFSALNGLTALRGAVVRKYYRARYDSDLDADLRSEMSGDELAKAQAQIEGKQSEADAIGLHDAIAGWGTDEAAIMKTLRNKSPAELEAIKAAYFAKYGETLDDALKGDLDEGNEIDQANALMSGDTATADAIALDEAMRGGFLGLGTSEGEIEEVYAQVRREVASRARAENWSSAQMEAEVRRRLGQIEGKFEERYKDVEQYNEPGLEGDTVLRRAYASELSGAEEDLAVALQDNDLIAADAARIEIERTGFYASDEKLNNVLKSQYERALEAKRLDQGPARNMHVQREVEKWRNETPQVSEEEISRRRMKLERQMESEMADAAQVDSKMAMGELEKLYQSNYTWPLSFVLDWNMSGTDRLAARDMLHQGGRLTALQEVEYATDQTGTDEDALRRRLSSMTKAEIDALRVEWEARHPGRSFDAMLRGELSGRDESDIMDMVEHGAPESAMGQIAQEQRRVKREIEDLTGVLGGVAAGNEEKWMKHQLAQLEEMQAPLMKTDWPEGEAGLAQREALQEKVAFRIQRVQDAVADHRRRIDSYTDAVTTVVGIVVGVVVAIVLGALTGGAGAAATFAVMAKIALASSLAATVSTMAAKRLIMGGSYGGEAFLTDLAVGGVDALTSVATAGMGSKLLGPMKNLVAKTRVGDVASWIGKTGVAQKLASGAERVAGGVQKLAPGLSEKAAGMAGKLMPTRAGMERGAASFLAEGFTDAVGAAPSSFVQIALTDSTWEGDPLANFLSGGGMAILQAVAMGRVMGAGMDVGSFAFGKARSHLRMGSDVGRLMEANQIITEGYGRFVQDNPGASLADFLAHPAGRKVRAEIESKNLLPTLESVTKAAAADPTLKAPREGADPNAKPPPQTEAEIRAAALESAVPKGLRDGTFVTPDPELAGSTVRVEPLRIGNKIVGVDVRVGPDATPLDVALHAATVHAMQRYRGVLGNVLRAIEDTAAKLLGTGMTVGSRGWEARLEMAKLPAIIASRMDGLAGAPLAPHLEAAIHADIFSLQQQLLIHQAILADPKLSAEPGRGYVAAENDPTKPKPGPDAKDSTVVPREAGAPKTETEAEVDPAKAKADFLLALKMRELELRIEHALKTGEGQPARELALKIAEETGQTVEAVLQKAGAPTPTPPRELQGRLTESEKALLAQARTETEAAMFADLIQALKHAKTVDERRQRLAKHYEKIAAELSLQDLALATKIFNDMVEWVHQESWMPRISGIDEAAAKALNRQLFNLDLQTRESFGDRLRSIENVKPTSERARQESAIVRELLDRLGVTGVNLPELSHGELIKWLKSEHAYEGRRPGASAPVDTLRPPKRPEPIESWVFDEMLKANIEAIAKLRARIEEIGPDLIFGVKRGGAFLAEVLAPEPGALPTNIIITEKAASGKRTGELREKIQAAIDAGQRKFVIVDFYMGGGAAGEFSNMIGQILRNAPPEIRKNLVFETLWLRETHGFERNSYVGGQLVDDGLVPANVIPPGRAGQLTQTIVPVRFVLGDDMHVMFDNNARQPIVIFDKDGEVVKVISVGVRHPKTGQVLSTPREILVALLQGYRF